MPSEGTAKVAKDAVKNAILSGKLKPKPCEKCGSKKNVIAHHDDYSKPLKVRWLCESCHRLYHNNNLSELSDLYLDNEYDEVSGVEILNVYPNVKGVEFTPEMFDEFISNFEKYRAEKTPHLKIDHTSQQAVLKALTGKDFEEGTELPNLGFVKKMYHNGKQMFADIMRVPRNLKDVIFGGKMFKAISPEATWNFRGTGDKVITALSLTNNPAQKHVLDVHMSENTSDTSARGGEDGTAIYFSGDIKIQEDTNMADTMKDQNATADAEVKFPDSAMETFSEKVAAKMAGLFGKKEEKSASSMEPVIALSEYNELKSQNATLSAEFNEIKKLLIQKESEQKNFSERVRAIEQSTRLEKAEAICKQALLDGVPKVVIEHFRPILLSEMGEQTIKLSEKVGEKVVEADKQLVEMIKDFFRIYPDKVDFSDRSATKIEEPGTDEDVSLSEINNRAKELMAEGLQKHEALEKAGLEILAKRRK